MWQWLLMDECMVGVILNTTNREILVTCRAQSLFKLLTFIDQGLYKALVRPKSSKLPVVEIFHWALLQKDICLVGDGMEMVF
mmetsp:Transcript_5551/g.8376  ORF Transcript_5551/g.8376 Transcript_5551/m.8376 type:complete len:82 (+) Transcript_5551:57-302(+)